MLGLCLYLALQACDETGLYWGYIRIIRVLLYSFYTTISGWGGGAALVEI